MYQDESKVASVVAAGTTVAGKYGFKYEYEMRVTFCHTNAEGNVNHFDYPKLFGVCRELFALDFIPDFDKEVGRKFLLKTRKASYEYEKDFYFGDIMRIQLWVREMTHATITLDAEFINAATGEVHARGSQQIVYTDMTGKPRRIPEHLKELMQAALNVEGRG